MAAELPEELYDALRALEVATEGSADPAGPSDVAMNITMLTMVRQDPAVWDRHLGELAALGLADRSGAGYRVTDAGYELIDAAMEAKVARMRERAAQGLSLFDDE